MITTSRPRGGHVSTEEPPAGDHPGRL